MKLPKGFGGQNNMGGLMKHAQEAMAKAQSLEQELALEEITVDKGPVKAIFTGTGEIKKVTIDKSVVDPEDIESLEDLIVSVVRDGFTKATDLRNERVQSITANIPNLGF